MRHLNALTLDFRHVPRDADRTIKPRPLSADDQAASRGRQRAEVLDVRQLERFAPTPPALPPELDDLPSDYDDAHFARLYRNARMARLAGMLALALGIAALCLL